jgi:hypothetical protein
MNTRKVITLLLIAAIESPLPGCVREGRHAGRAFAVAFPTGHLVDPNGDLNPDSQIVGAAGTRGDRHMESGRRPQQEG